MPKYKIDYNTTLNLQRLIGNVLLEECSDGRKCPCHKEKLCDFNIRLTTALIQERDRKLGL